MKHDPIYKRLFISQYGDKYYVKTIKELQSQIGGKVIKMYHDYPDGKARHVGYVIGKSWLTEYSVVARE